MRLSRGSLLALLALFNITTAFDLNAGFIDKRQVAATGNTGSGTGPSQGPSQPTGASQTPTTANTPTVTPTDPPPTTTQPTQGPTGPASSPPPDDTDSGTTSSPTEKPTSRTNGVSSTRTTGSPTTRTSALVSSSTQVFTTTIVTVSGGVTLSQVATSSRVVQKTTGYATYTSTPGLNGDDNSSGSGLSDSSKRIIGGVVGGVGGAILLGGIGIVLWRIYGKKRRNADDDYDDYMSGGTDSLKRRSVNQPFQSTLDSYHTPGQKPSAAANF